LLCKLHKIVSYLSTKASQEGDKFQMQVKGLNLLAPFTQKGIQHTQIDVGYIGKPPGVKFSIGHRDKNEIHPFTPQIQES
jgi:hypothetical protein